MHNQATHIRQLFKATCLLAGLALLLFGGYLLFLLWGYHHVNATYEHIDRGMTRQQVDAAIGWYSQTEIDRSDVEPGWEPRSSGDITKCGFGSFYFYVVYENAIVVEVIPAFE